MSNRKTYDNELKALEEALQSMGALARQSIDLVLATLRDGDRSRLAQIPVLRDQLTQLERGVEHQCLALLLRQQPVASDLRKVSTSLKVVEDLRRIGDFAVDMADILKNSDAAALQSAPFHGDICSMAENARTMTDRALTAFHGLDCAAANAVIADDDVVDADFLAIRDKLASHIATQSGSVEIALDDLMLAKYLERLGDHAVSIAEWTLFCATGIHKNQRIV